MARAKNSRNKSTWDGGEAEFDWAAFSKIRRSPEVLKLLEQVGEGIAQEAEQYPEHSEPGYENRKRYSVDVHVGRHATNAVVFPSSPHAWNSNAKHNTLIKLLGKGDRV